MAERTYLATRLREARKAAGMTLEGAGKAVGKSSKPISAYEAAINEPSIETLLNLCRTYGVDIRYFFVKFPEDGDEAARSEEEELASLYRASSPEGRRMIMEHARMVAEFHPGRGQAWDS